MVEFSEKMAHKIFAILLILVKIVHSLTFCPEDFKTDSCNKFCGSNGKTYSNCCSMLNAMMTHDDLLVNYTGPCIDPNIGELEIAKALEKARKEHLDRLSEIVSNQEKIAKKMKKKGKVSRISNDIYHHLLEFLGV